MPAQAASLAAEVVQLIRTLITAAAVAGFDETTLRYGPSGGKKYVHGAFTEQHSAFWLGARSLDSMQSVSVNGHPQLKPGVTGVSLRGRPDT